MVVLALLLGGQGCVRGLAGAMGWCNSCWCQEVLYDLGGSRTRLIGTSIGCGPSPEEMKASRRATAALAVGMVVVLALAMVGGVIAYRSKMSMNGRGQSYT